MLLQTRNIFKNCWEDTDKLNKQQTNKHKQKIFEHTVNIQWQQKIWTAKSINLKLFLTKASSLFPLVAVTLTQSVQLHFVSADNLSDISGYISKNTYIFKVIIIKDFTQKSHKRLKRVINSWEKQQLNDQS